MQGELSGRRLGNYRLDSVLGRGGMGVVYRAEQISLGRVVAVKVIAPALAQDPMLRGRFKKEARLAASLDHPNVLPIHEADEAEGLLYIAMRFVEGVDLGDAIRHQGRLSTQAAAEIVMQIGGALDAAHSRGLVHRDVKPANVLLAGPAAPVAYLTDFGLTKHVEAVSGPTQSGQFVGTPDYAAPEQIKGHAVNAATDVYALGCVLHEALTGSVPFPRDSNVAKMYAHISDPPPRPSDVADGISPALDEVVARALSKDPAERHPSAGDLGRAAVAAATNRRAPSTEHSVAVGEAALTPATEPSPPAPPDRRESAPTAHLPDDTPPAPAALPPQPIQIQDAGAERRSRALVVVAALAIVAVLAAGSVAALVLTRDDSPGGSSAAAATPAPVAATAPQSATQPTQTSPSTTTDTPAQGLLPAEPRSEMAAEITDMLRRFYTRQVNQDYKGVWALTTKRYRDKQLSMGPYSEWVGRQTTGAKWFADPERLTATIASTDPEDGSVAVRVSGMRYTDPESDCSEWAGVTWARWVNGAWRHDPSLDATSKRQDEWRAGDVIGDGCIVYR